ncbi:MAG: ABC transporter permease [Fulvivirga sp.]|uniref:ABC transporter permease n=1 Tax=Fulvivirga sp. TaxID=1931237 RepID=UPI0032EC0A15
MFRNILKIAYRNFVKTTLYSLLNVIGLAVGIASCLLISSYVLHETSYDTFYKDTDRIYRVNMTNIWMPEGGVMSSTVPPLALVLSADYPEIESALRINTMGSNIFRLENDRKMTSYYEEDILAADSNFFSFFDFELLYGDPASALVGKNKIVISEDVAIKYFGKTDVIGEEMLMGEERTPLTITGITATQPTNAHFNFDFLVSIYTNERIKHVENNWIWTQVVTYVKLVPDAKPEQLEAKLKDLAPTHAAPVLERWGISYDEFLADKGDWLFYVQPVKDIYLNSAAIGNRIGPVSDAKYMYIFSFTAVFILILAVINFINLATARATVRAKEIGIRKVLGSVRSQLILQFISESIINCLIAGLLALGLSEFLKIAIENYLGSTFHTTEWTNVSTLLIIFMALIVLGVMAGLYPAFSISAYKPVNVLKGQLRSGNKAKWFRNALVVLQFSISSTLMICTFIVYQQLQFFTEKDLGYDRENVIVLNWADKLGTHLDKFHHEILNHPQVINASVSMDVIGRGSYEDIFGDVASGYEQPIAMMKADERQLETMKIDLVHGRFFKEGNKADERSVVINESTMELFGYTEENVLGQEIYYGGDDMGKAKVIGVVKDFNFYTLHAPIAPYIFYHINAGSGVWGNARVISIRTREGNPAEFIQFLENKWNAYVDNAPFDFSFLDQEYENQYRQEQQLGGLFAVFTVIAILIACLGLFGLASYVTNERVKEIGIRKVLGASVMDILSQFSGGFGKLILISLIIAAPIAWYAMDNWLSQFIYRIDIQWWVFVVIGGIVLIISSFTVGYHSIKASLTNPTDVLTDE